jgi:hypothetical protein
MAIKPNQLSPEPLSQSAYSSAPTTGASKGAWGVKVINGVAEGMYIDSNGNEVQLTSGGSPIGGGGGGETNTGSNVGATGAGVFKQKSGVQLQFRKIKAGANVTVTENADDIEISASGGGSGEANTASNLGSGAQVFKQKTGVNFEMRSLIASAPLATAQNANDITISASIASQSEAEAGAVNDKLMTPLRTAQAIAALAEGGGSSNEFVIKLGAGSDLATRIADGFTSVPAGWSVQPASVAAITGIHSTAADLAVTHGLAMMPALVSIMQVRDSGPAAVQRYDLVNKFADANVKANISLNSFSIADLVASTDASFKVIIFVKLVSLA